MTQDTKALMTRYFEALNRRDLDALSTLIADDLINHAAIPEAQGISGFRRILGKLVEAFPDAHWQCEDIVAEGDRVVCRVKMSGTNSGPLNFLRYPLPATGRKVESEALHLFRVKDGKLVEHWAGRDDIGMMRQLGHVPVPEARA